MFSNQMVIPYDWTNISIFLNSLFNAVGILFVHGIFFKNEFADIYLICIKSLSIIILNKSISDCKIVQKQ